MFCATISLPTPVSPVMSTFVSDDATRLTSCSRAAISALRPINLTECFARMGMAAPTITRALSTWTSLVDESLNELPMFGADGHEHRPDSIPLVRTCGERGDPGYGYVC